MEFTKNPYVEQMLTAAADYLRLEKERGTKLEKLEKVFNAGAIARNSYDAETVQFKEAAKQNQAALVKSVSDTLSKYTARVQKWAEPKGGDLTPDYALLTGQMQLSANDLNVLARRYALNATMQRAIEQYARKHEIHFSMTPTPEQKIESMTAIAGFISSIPNSPYYAGFVQKEDAMSDYLKQYDGIIGDSSELKGLN